MYQTYFDQRIRNATLEFVEEAIVDSISALELTTQLKEEKNKLMKEDLQKRLARVQVVPMFPDEVSNQSRVNEIYTEMEVDGSESLIALHVAIDRHAVKLELEPSDLWAGKVRSRAKHFQTFDYVLEENVLSKIRNLSFWNS